MKLYRSPAMPHLIYRLNLPKTNSTLVVLNIGQEIIFTAQLNDTVYPKTSKEEISVSLWNRLIRTTRNKRFLMYLGKENKRQELLSKF